MQARPRAATAALRRAKRRYAALGPRGCSFGHPLRPPRCRVTPAPQLFAACPVGQCDVQPSQPSAVKRPALFREVRRIADVLPKRGSPRFPAPARP
ncbi:hypothetical protein PMIN01_03959 [Paraphaeosphaeria minitans]|uniref:Uncharacterized protein n=1 Tax=Paraphaeosphaeria minitans TaxID=565426 RepID=A0A9P6GNT6_9PLEO|nr:hypothetical protein PMIN01_03959 [Paraphaeosphaeria minitans]